MHTRRDDESLPERVRHRRTATTSCTSPPGRPRELPKDDLLPHMPALRAACCAGSGRRTPPDVVHAHFWMSGLASVEAAAGAARAGAGAADLPRARLGQAPPPGRGRHLAGRPDRARARAVPRRRPRRRHLLRRGVRAAPARAAAATGCRSCPCGVDTAVFTPRGPVAPRTGRPRLLVLGRLVERKGQDDAVRALPRGARRRAGRRRRPAARRAGRRPGGAAAARGRRRGRAWPTGWCSPGRCARADVPAWVRSADVVLAVPWYEPFGITPLEAMACGRPVVATAVGGLRRHRGRRRHRRPGAAARPRAARRGARRAARRRRAPRRLRRRRACSGPAPATAGAASSPTPKPSTGRSCARRPLVEAAR